MGYDMGTLIRPNPEIDDSKWVGMIEFTKLHIQWEFCEDDPDDHAFTVMRPRFPDEAIEEVKNCTTIPDANKRVFIDAIELCRNNPNIWLYGSW